MNVTLTLRVNESVVIDTPRGPVTVTVFRAGPRQVRLGVDADPAIPIDRGEVSEEHRRLREGRVGR